MDDKLTQKSQEALSAAVRRAAAEGHPQVEPQHLLVALLGAGGRHGRAAAGGGRRRLAGAPEAGRGAAGRDAEGAAAPRCRRRDLSRPLLQRSVNTAATVPSSWSDEYVSTEHLLVGLAADGGPTAVC